MVDVGGTHVKLMTNTVKGMRRFDSGKDMTAQKMVDGVLEMAEDWDYDAVSMGYPGRVEEGKPSREPANLAEGWVHFDYEQAFGCPVRILNDAAMQALGKYRGGRMLFLGFGTSVGSTLIANRVIVPLELGLLKLQDGRAFMDRLTKKSLRKRGRKKWSKSVLEAVDIAREIFNPSDIVIGGGNAKEIDPFPKGCRRGSNRDAFAGAMALWESPEHLRAP
jgi:polyphosphate glucokinase